MNITVILIITLLIYLQYRFSIMKIKFIKKLIIRHFSSKKNGEYMIRAIISIILTSLLFVYIYLNIDITYTILSENSILYNIILMIVSILVFVQILFCINYLISSIFKISPIEFMKHIDIMKVDMDNFIYTAYIVTLSVSLFEVIIFFDIIYNILMSYNDIFWLNIIIVSIIYAFMKAMLRNNYKKSYSLFILGFSLAIPGLLILIISESLLLTTLFMYICNIFISCKDIRIKNWR